LRLRFVGKVVGRPDAGLQPGPRQQDGEPLASQPSTQPPLAPRGDACRTPPLAGGL